ncbi:MAG: RHS repeat protein [Acidobacteria bacterium]|nr:RHS repeat protein [Acidobacteriota bacterium]
MDDWVIANPNTVNLTYSYVNDPSRGQLYAIDSTITDTTVGNGYWNCDNLCIFVGLNVPNYVGYDSVQYHWNVVLPQPEESNHARINIMWVGDDRQNAGDSCPASVGRPVNVTNGNMWIRQTDFLLPGLGENIEISRFYNSMIQTPGLFGLGWSTKFDESLTFYGTQAIQYNQANGKAEYFGRYQSTDPFTAFSKDFVGELVANSTGTYTITDQAGTSRDFSALGKLIKFRDRNGNETVLTYDLNGNLTTVTDAGGQTLTLTPNADGTTSEIRQGATVIASYEYWTGTTKLKMVTYPDGSKYQFEYANVGSNTYIATVKDALGYALEHHDYDPSGRAITSEVDGGKEKYTFTYGLEGGSAWAPFRTRVTDGLGRIKDYYFQKMVGHNILWKVDGQCCGGGGSESTTYYYNEYYGTTASKVDALGNQTTYQYDSDRNVTNQTDVRGTQKWTYNNFGEILTYQDRVDSQSNPPVYTEVNTYDSTGNLLTRTDALGKVTTLEYPTTGNIGLPKSVKDARNNETKLKWYATGLLQEIEDPYTKKSSFAYDSRGRIASITNSLGHVTTYNYFDDTSRKVELVYPNSDKITYKYDIRRLLESVTDERGKVTNYEFDPQRRLTKITDPLGHIKQFGYDAMSNMTSYTDPLGKVTTYEPDDFDRLKKITYPAATSGGTALFEQYQYDKLGRVTKYTDTAGRETNYAYNDTTRTNTVTNAEAEVTTTKYDPRFQTTEVKDAINQTYTFAYDPLGRLLSQTRAGGTMTFEYDEVGNRKKRTDYAGRVTNYTYDNLNRLTKISYGDPVASGAPPNAEATYGFDDLSRLTSATNEAGTVGFTYDNRNRLKTETDVFGHLLEYGYDAASNRTQLKLDGSVHTAYVYDDANRLTTLTDEVGQNFTFGYDIADRMTSRTMPNGITSTFEYDGMSRLTRLKHQSLTATLFDNQYLYNTANQISQITGLANTRVFGYDLVDRLKTVSTNGTQTESYAFDDVGNRTASHLSATYGYQSGKFNQLASTATATMQYDANGNIIRKSEGSQFWRYVWDQENRLTEAATRKQKVRYKYDALGRRVERNFGFKERTKFTHDGLDVVMDDDNNTGLTKYQNGLGIDDKLKFSNAGASSYFLQDHLGSTLGLSNSAASVNSSASYDSFGNATGNLATRYQFTGREYDSFTGQHYYRARFYDANLGRFISEDPISLGGGINPFAYVGNNSMNRTDPSGLYEIDVHYYLTYYLAMKTGCFSRPQAVAIANGNQLTDENPNSLPGLGRGFENSTYHGLNGGARPGAGAPDLWPRSTNFPQLGQYLHYYQDTFSHEGYTNSTFGHALPGHYFDKTNSDPEKAMRMAQGTFSQLVSFARQSGCSCKSEWTNEMQTTVDGFNRSPGSNFGYFNTIDSKGSLLDWGLTNPSGYLDNKIRFLGVPNR